MKRKEKRTKQSQQRCRKLTRRGEMRVLTPLESALVERLLVGDATLRLLPLSWVVALPSVGHLSAALGKPQNSKWRWYVLGQIKLERAAPTPF